MAPMRVERSPATGDVPASSVGRPIGSTDPAACSRGRRSPFATALRRRLPAALAATVTALAANPARADGDDALEWLRTGDCQRAGEAINAGLAKREARAYLLAGYLYDLTGCVEPDAAKAIRFYERAIELGDPEARKFLGLMDGLGRGVPQDDRAAHRWYAMHPDAEPAAEDPVADVVTGYAQTIVQLARAKVEYPRNPEFQEGTIHVIFHVGTGEVEFARARTEDGHRALTRSTPFTSAISNAYALALSIAPKPPEAASSDVAYDVPWTFLLR